MKQKYASKLQELEEKEVMVKEEPARKLEEVEVKEEKENVVLKTP